ncbi:MAG: T9SS type A sorting domain-containing protein [Bacteroidia bacterium]|nr:T9SS type A sorting domain-containing protein [Bacteroidia bacterium]
MSILLFVLIECTPVNGQGGVQTVFYASPGGSGSACTQGSPGSLTEVLNLVSASTARMGGDIVVYLYGGRYQVDQTITLTEAHSGQNGHYVIFRNVDGQLPVISGGIPITGWTDSNSDGIYEAPVTDGFRFRQLYVASNTGRIQRAIRARIPNIDTGADATPDDVDFDNYWFNLNATKDGALYLPVKNEAEVPVSVVQNMSASELQKVELFNMANFNGRCYLVDTFTDIGGNMARLSYRGLAFDTDARAGIKTDYYLENAFSFLDAEREWFLDETLDKVYYKPATGENMSTIDVVAPKLETVIELNKAHHIKFFGLQFSHNTFLRASDEGIIERIGGYYRVMQSAKGVGTIMKNCIEMYHAHHIVMERNLFRDIGSNGVSLNIGNHDIHIAGNIFTEISSTGILVDAATNHTPAKGDGEWNINVADNFFYKTGIEYLGGSGITVAEGSGVFIDYNDFKGNNGFAMHLGPSGQFDNLERMARRLIKSRRNDFSRASMWGSEMGMVHLIMPNNGGEFSQNYLHDVPLTHIAHGKLHIIHNDGGIMWWLFRGNYSDSVDMTSFYDLKIMNAAISNPQDFRLRDVFSGQTPCYIEDGFMYPDGHASGASISASAGIRSGYNDIYSYINDYSNNKRISDGKNPSEFIDLAGEFTENFENYSAGSVPTSSDWLPLEFNDWEISNDNGNKVLESPITANAIIDYRVSNYLNFDFESKFKLITNPSSLSYGGIAFSLRNDYDVQTLRVGYDFSDDKWKISRRQPDVSTYPTSANQETSFIGETIELAASAVQKLNANQWYCIKAEVMGDTVRLLVDNVEKATALVSKLSPGGIAIVADSVQAYFDDIAITAVNDPLDMISDDKLNANISRNCPDNDPDCIYYRDFEADTVSAPRSREHLLPGWTGMTIHTDNRNTIGEGMWQIQLDSDSRDEDANGKIDRVYRMESKYDNAHLTESFLQAYPVLKNIKVEARVKIKEYKVSNQGYFYFYLRVDPHAFDNDANAFPTSNGIDDFSPLMANYAFIQVGWNNVQSRWEIRECKVDLMAGIDAYDSMRDIKDGIFTNKATSSAAGPTVGKYEDWKITMNGVTITLLVNGVQKIQTSALTITDPGRLGIEGGGDYVEINNIKVSSLDPNIRIDQENMVFETPVDADSTSISRSFPVWGASLTANIAITSPTGYEVSTDNINFSDSVSVASNASNLSVYVRFAPVRGTANGTKVTGDIELLSSGAISRYISMEGQVTAFTPSLTTNVDTLTALPGSFKVTGHGLTENISVSTCTDMELSADCAVFVSSLMIPADATNVNIYVKEKSGQTVNLDRINLTSGTQKAAVTIATGKEVIIPGLKTTTDKQGFKLYPNPAASELYITTNEIIREIKIFGVDGKLQFENNWINSNQLRVNLSRFTSGLYIINLKDAQGRVIQSKFLKE